MNVLYNNLLAIKNSFAAIRDKFKASWSIDYTGKATATYSDMVDDLSSILDQNGKRREWSYAFQETDIKTIPPLDYGNAGWMNGTFQNCPNLSGDVTIVGGSSFNGTFKNCAKIENAYITPNQNLYSITTDNMFYGCTGLKTVEINVNEDVYGSPTGAPSINYMFYSCRNLETIKYIIIKGSSGRITMNYTFYNCKNLVSLLKPVTLTGLTSANKAFYNCSKLANVEFQGTLDISLDLSSCVSLTSDSLHSLMSTLADGVSGLILNIGSVNIAKLEADYPDDIPTAEGKGWAVV